MNARVGAVALAAIAIGLVALTVVAPMAAAGPAQLRDDHNGKCPGGWVADYYPSVGTPPDYNGNAAICYRP